MTGNNLKIIWRSLMKGKAYSLINIIGLATGMAVALLISLWIYDEVSYNKSFANHKLLAQVRLNQSNHGDMTTEESMAVPVGHALKSNYPSDFEKISFVSYNNDHLLAIGDKKIIASGVMVQQDFPQMFSLEMTEGSNKNFNDPTTILISRSLANSLFGKEDATGKVLKLDNELEMKVGGVFADFPRNTTFFDTRIILPWEIKINWAKDQTAWDNHCTRIFAQLTPQADLNITIAKIKNLPTPHIKEWREELLLQPMDKMYLYNGFVNGKAITGRIRFVWLFGIIGSFVLFLACINFMNLSTARSEKRAKEVGIRKSIGALRGQMIRQFLSESVVMSLLSFFVAIILVMLTLPFFNGMADKQMKIFWTDPLFWLIAFGFTIFTGIIAGSYPAFYLSAFKPVKVLKGTFKAGRSALLPRRILVVVQFTVSIALIIGTIVVFRQVEFAKSRPIGYSREGLITVPLSGNVNKHFDAVRNELLQTGAISNVAASSQATTKFNNNNSMEWRGKDPSLVQFFRDVNVTHDFGKTIGWTILQGRDFSRDYATDSTAAIINTSAAKIMGFKDPVGETIRYGGNNFTIVGVSNDMITQSPYDPLQASVFFCSGWLTVVTIRIKPGEAVNNALAKIAPVLKKYDPDIPFSYNFVDTEYAKKFSNEERVGNLAGFFAVLAIFISCLGLFGLASFVAEQRTKEIGIRKVLGASVMNVWKLLSKEFVLLTIISFFIAIPVAYYYMHSWLQDYQYRSPISWWIFAITAAGALLITLLTVSFQAIKAAITNPVKSLRME